MIMKLLGLSHGKGHDEWELYDESKIKAIQEYSEILFPSSYMVIRHNPELLELNIKSISYFIRVGEQHDLKEHKDIDVALQEILNHKPSIDINISELEKFILLWEGDYHYHSEGNMVALNDCPINLVFKEKTITATYTVTKKNLITLPYTNIDYLTFITKVKHLIIEHIERLKNNAKERQEKRLSEPQDFKTVVERVLKTEGFDCITFAFGADKFLRPKLKSGAGVYFTDRDGILYVKFDSMHNKEYPLGTFSDPSNIAIERVTQIARSLRKIEEQLP